MNDRQAKAIEHIHWFATQYTERGTPEHPAVATFEVEEKDWGGLFVVVHYDIPTLSEGNALRFLVSSSWYQFFIGPRGAIKAIHVPKSMEQFNGKRISGVLIEIV